MKKITEKISSNLELIIASAIIASGISYGLVKWNPFFDTFSILSALLIGGWLIYFNSIGKLNDSTTVINEKLQEYEMVIDELNAIIKEFEIIFDQQTVELPCVCGGNTFKGLFSPTMDNFCECEKCNNKYKVTLDFDTILISEPLENQSIFDAIKKGA